MSQRNNSLGFGTRRRKTNLKLVEFWKLSLLFTCLGIVALKFKCDRFFISIFHCSTNGWYLTLNVWTEFGGGMCNWG